MANLKTMLQQIQTKLLAQAWPGGSAPAFGSGSVVISRYEPAKSLTSMRVPIAMIMPADWRADPRFGEEPDFWSVRVVVRIIVAIPGDAIGQKPLVGANRPDATKSEGAGLLDLEQVVYTAIGKLNVADHANFAIQFRQKGGAGGIHVDEVLWWEYQDLEFEAWVTAN